MSNWKIVQPRWSHVPSSLECLLIFKTLCVCAGVERGGGGPRPVLLPVQRGLVPGWETHHLSAGRR